MREKVTATHKKGAALYALLAFNAVLFLAMLVLCGVYLNMRINGVHPALPEIPANDKWILTGSGYDVQSGAKPLISPSFIGYKTADGAMTAATFDTSARENLMEVLADSLNALLAGTHQRVPFQSDAERRAYVAELCEAERFVYVSFFGELPADALLPSLRGGSFPKLSEKFFVKYMFLLPDENDSLYAVCLDADRNAVLLQPEQPLPYTGDKLRAYTGMRGYVDFAFEKPDPAAAMFTRSFDVNSVIIQPSSAFYTFEPEDDKTKKLLKTLDFNTNMVKYFRSGDNSTASFVDDGRELYVSIEEGTVTYSASESGIHLSAFLGYYPANGKTYTFEDAVLCVKYMLHSLDRILVGGDAAPALVGVTRSGEGALLFSLKYFYNGVMLTDNAADITVEISGNRVTKLHIVMLFCDGGRLTKPVLPQKLALELLTEKTADETYEYHALFESEPATNQVKLVWVAGKAVGE